MNYKMCVENGYCCILYHDRWKGYLLTATIDLTGMDQRILLGELDSRVRRCRKWRGSLCCQSCVSRLRTARL